MLYSFSQPHYEEHAIKQIIANATLQDALLFWQDGVVFLLKNAPIFEEIFPQIYVLEQDLQARGLHPFFTDISKNIRIICLSELVELTTSCYPQIAY